MNHSKFRDQEAFSGQQVKFESYQKPDPVDMLISIIQVFGFADGSVSQGEEYISNCPGIPWREEEFHRAAFWGQRAFCFHGWSG
jgi:hypothetical protein